MWKSSVIEIARVMIFYFAQKLFCVTLTLQHPPPGNQAAGRARQQSPHLRAHLLQSNLSIFEKIADIISSTEPQPPDLGRLSSLSSHPHLPQLGGRPCFHRHSNNSPQGTSFDDFGLEQLGRHVPGLLTLNVARTRVSDRGLVGLQVSI